MSLLRVEHRRALATAAVVLGAVATASNPVFVRLSDVGLIASAFHRMFWAVPVIFVWVLLSRRGGGDSARMTSRDRVLLGLCGAFFAADLVALHTSISLTYAANSILFLNAQPIYVVIAAWLLFGTSVSRRFVLAAAVAMLGALMLVWQSASFGGDYLLGDGLGVVAGLCYAGYILAAARLRDGRSSAVINLWTCVVGAPLLLVAALAAGQDVVPPTARDWSLMIALGVVSRALGQGLIVWGLAYLPSSFSSVALLVAPVAAAVFARLLLDEVLTVMQVAGMLVVLAGIYSAWRASFPAAIRAAAKPTP
ncbi:MAG: DMT family transporter [Gammaproteobacteria bacterium]|nr:DMT family transporter [Gammaproteobacteria bacterium]